jgi:hypothetical protein
MNMKRYRDSALTVGVTAWVRAAPIHRIQHVIPIRAVEARCLAHLTRQALSAGRAPAERSASAEERRAYVRPLSSAVHTVPSSGHACWECPTLESGRVVARAIAREPGEPIRRIEYAIRTRGIEPQRPAGCCGCAPSARRARTSARHK